MPDKDAVLAITGGTGDMQKPLNLVWDILLPAMNDEALPEDKEAVKNLEQKLASLKLKTVEGGKTSKVAQNISGKTFVFEENDRGMQSILFDTQNMKITAKTAQGERIFSPGYNDWKKSSMPFMSPQVEPVAVCGAWVTPEHYQMKVAATETPYIQTLDFLFSNDEVLLNVEFNVMFGERKWPAIKGKI